MQWEIKTDRSQVVLEKNTNQWIQRDGTVSLIALWLHGDRHQDMQPAYEFNEAWNPLLEVSPWRIGKHTSISNPIWF